MIFGINEYYDSGPSVNPKGYNPLICARGMLYRIIVMTLPVRSEGFGGPVQKLELSSKFQGGHASDKLGLGNGISSF